MISDKNFFDLHFENGDIPSFCYRSSMTVYEERLFNGVLIPSGINAAGYPLGILECMPTHLNPDNYSHPSAFNIDIDGRSIDHSLEFVDLKVERDEHRLESVLILDSLIKPVRLKIHTVLDGSQMMSRYFEIENLSDSELTLSRLALISGGLEELDFNRFKVEDINKVYSFGYFESDKWGREGEFVWHELTPESHSVSTRFGADRFRHPFVMIRNNITGTFFFYQLGWSAGCRFTADFMPNSNRTASTLAFSAEITSYNPMAVIAPHETFVTPQIHIGAVTGDLDDAVNEMHKHIRRSVLNLPEADPSACLVGSGYGAEHSMSLKASKEAVDQFARMGAEVFIVDAGWECPPGLQTSWGDYSGTCVADKDRYPNGIGELVDYCHSKGMKFGLWADIESFGRLCKNFTEHPEWRAKNIYGKTNPRLIDMSIPEVAQWAENELRRIITEYKIDLLRVDHNVSHKEYYAFNGGECNSLRHHSAVYKMYNNLKKEFPGVIFENCAGGGARTDLGMMQNFNHTWVSDCQRAPYSVSITNGMTMVLPPERVDRLFAGMGCHDQGSFDLHMRNTMLTHMSLNIISQENCGYNSEQMDFIRHSVGIYKDFIRPFLPVAKTYHHTPEAMREGRCILEVASPDCSKGAIGVFALDNKSAGRITVYPKGISQSKKYKVMLDNSRAEFEISGYELSVHGISVTLPCPLTSELILYSEKE